MEKYNREKEKVETDIILDKRQQVRRMVAANLQKKVRNLLSFSICFQIC